MNTTATYIAAQTAKEIKAAYNRQKWLEHKPEIVRVLNELQPDIPKDGIPGFLAYEVDGHDRMKMRTGRFLTRKLKLNSGLLPDTAIQHIAAQINTRLFDSADEVRLDSGRQIRDNYSLNIGGNSCMSGSNSHYTGLYADNPDKIKQLVMVSVNDTARAIIHVLDNGKYHMSRVYATSEDLKQRMIDYAHNQGWLYRGDSIPDRNILVVSGLDYTEGEIPYADSLTGYRIDRHGLTMVHSSLWHDGTLDSTCGQFGNSYECCCCGEGVSEDDCYSEGDEIYCHDCYCNNFTPCGRCDEAYPNDCCTWIESTNESVCESCLANYTRCDDCNEYFINDNTYPVDDGDKSVCESCLANYTRCDDCGEWFSELEYNEEENETGYCIDCAEDRIKLIPIKDCEGQLLLQTE